MQVLGDSRLPQCRLDGRRDDGRGHYAVAISGVDGPEVWISRQEPETKVEGSTSETVSALWLSFERQRSRPWLLYSVKQRLTGRNTTKAIATRSLWMAPRGKLSFRCATRKRLLAAGREVAKGEWAERTHGGGGDAWRASRMSKGVLL